MNAEETSTAWAHTPEPISSQQLHHESDHARADHADDAVAARDGEHDRERGERQHRQRAENPAHDHEQQAAAGGEQTVPDEADEVLPAHEY